MATPADRYALVFLAKVAQQAERYDDMVATLKKLASFDVELSVEERNLLCAAYSRVIGARRDSWRILSSTVQEKEESNEIVRDYCLRKVARELTDICNDAIKLIDDHLLPFSSTNTESTVLYYKMKGDYYRYIYIAELECGDDKKEAADHEALKAYEAGTTAAEADLSPIHPIRLGLALNFSVLYYEIMNSPEKACYLAKQAIYEAIDEVDNLSHVDTCKDSRLIMQLLRENLTLWSSDMNPQDGGKGYGL